MNGSPTPSSSARRRGAGFTLIEMLTVIIIILILLGLGVAIGPGLLGVGEEIETKTTLKHLELINSEYKALKGESVQLDLANFANAKAYWQNSMQHFVSKTANLPTTQPIYARIMPVNRKYMLYTPRDIEQDAVSTVSTTSSANTDIADAWGLPIIYKAADCPVTGNPQPDFIPNKGGPYFVSAGPDGKIGSVVDGTPSDPVQKVTLDNIYSDELLGNR